MSTSILEVRGLQKRYRQPWAAGSRMVYALNGVDLVVAPGETLGVVGESGSGKSTLGRLVLGLEPPSGGTVVFEGADLATLDRGTLRRARRRMQIVFQDPYTTLNPRHTVGDAVAEGLLIHRMAAGDALRTRVAQLLETVGIGADDAARYPHEFSGGQRQRIAIARALAVDPVLLICDEPVASLDVATQSQILSLLRQLQTGRGLSTMFIAHDLGVVARMAHRVAVMYSGRVVETGPVAAVIGQPGHPYTAALVASAPRLHPAAGKPRTVLVGEPPVATKPPQGCPFRDRCSHPGKDGRCATELPLLRPVGAVEVACHHATKAPA